MSEQPDTSRKVVNSNIGISNIIPETDIKTTMMDTLTQLLDVLKTHCGPYAKNAILAPQTFIMGEPIFTTDGINIVKSIEYANPLQEFVKSMVVHIGSRIDSVGADGTTSSMSIMIMAMKKLMDVLSAWDNVTQHELKTEYNGFVDLVLEELDKLIIHFEDLSWDKEDMKYHPAYLQALTSSKGDEELAKISWELFKGTPKKAWDHVIFERSVVETDTKYSLEIDDSDYSMRCNPFTKSVLRGADGMSVDKQETKLYIFNQAVMVDGVYWDSFSTIIESAKETGDSVTIILKNNNIPTQLQLYLDDVMIKASEHNINIFTVNIDNEQINDVNNMILLAGRSPAVLRSQYAEPISCTIEYVSGSLYVEGLVPVEDDGTGICAMVGMEEEYPVYNQIIEAIPGYIESIRSDTRDPGADRKARELQHYYNKLLLTKRATVIVGGTAYDNHESVDICIDALGATRNTLLYGYTIGGMSSLEVALINLIQCKSREMTSLQCVFANAFLDAIDTLKQTIVDNAPYRIRLIHKDSSEDRVFKDGKRIPIEDVKLLDVISGDYTNKIIQPATIDKEIIKRFGEVALKFVMSNKVMIPHSVYKPGVKSKDVTPIIADTSSTVNNNHMYGWGTNDN